MDKKNPYEGLFPGDYFIHRIEMGGEIFHAYGFLKGKDHAGNLYSDYQCSVAPTQELRIDAQRTEVVGRITKRAYLLAKLRNWPDSDEGILAIIAFSGGREGVASLMERIRLLFMTP